MNPGVSNTKSTGFGQNQRDVGVKYQQGVVRGRDGLVLLRRRGRGRGGRGNTHTRMVRLCYGHEPDQNLLNYFFSYGFG